MERLFYTDERAKRMRKVAANIQALGKVYGRGEVH